MTKIVELLAEYGGFLALGSTLFLGLAILAIRFCREPVHRQRLGESAIGAALCWLVLTSVPLPRLDLFGLGWTTRIERVGQEPTQGTSGESLPSVAGNRAAAGDFLDQRESPAKSSAGTRPEGAVLSSHDLQPAKPYVAPTATQVPWQRGLAALYLTGSAICLLWLATGHILLICSHCRASNPEPWLAAAYESLPVPGRLRRARLLVSRRCRRPIVYGLWRPRIVLPSGLCLPENVGQLRHVLLHELAHVWRGDAWGHLLFSLACPLLYCHPFYWWVRGEVQFARELVADDWAARFGAKESYVEELVHLMKSRPLLVPSSMGVLGGYFYFRSQFFRRMTMLIRREEPLVTKPSKRWRIVAFSGFGAFLSAMVLSVGVPPLDVNSPASATAAEQPSAVPEPESTFQLQVTSQQPEQRVAEHGAADAGAGGREETEDLLMVRECRVSPVNDVAVPARAAGVVSEMRFKEGAPIARGALLARIDHAEARQRMDSAQAALRHVRILELNVEVARLEAEHAREEHGRKKSLAEGAVVPQSEMLSAEFAMEQSLLRLKVAEEEVSAAREAGGVELQAAERKIALGQITAPIDGIVVEKYCQIGEWVRQGDPVCRIINVDRLRVEGFAHAERCFPAELAGRDVEIVVKLPRSGSENEVARNHGPAVTTCVRGKITFVSPEVKVSRFRFRAEFENPKQNGRWVARPGLEVTVNIKLD